MSQTVFEFQGYMMRSHSERRWAEMMDALRIQWVYEPGLVETRHGWYLPDFYLPGAGVYLEVKGPRPSQVEIDKARDLQAATGRPVIFAFGDMVGEGVNHVQGGFLLCLSQHSEVEYSTYEFGPHIRARLGESEWLRYLRAGIKRGRPDCTMIGEAIRDLLISRMERSAREQHMASLHREINERRLAAASVRSQAEYAIGHFFERIQERWKIRKEAA